jgi:hypothetical protein
VPRAVFLARATATGGVITLDETSRCRRMEFRHHRAVDRCPTDDRPSVGHDRSSATPGDAVHLRRLWRRSKPDVTAFEEEDTMRTRRTMFPLLALSLLSLLAVTLPTARAQGRYDPAAVLAAQRQALAKLAFMDGVWRGPAWTILPSGEKHEVTQTERIGPFLDGAVKVIEGRGYDASGKVGFNAFGIVSFDPDKNAYTLHSYAMGRAGDFTLTPSDTGYVWEIPAGPATMRYTAWIRKGTWREIGERIAAGQPAAQFFEMNLVRVGSTDWPASGAVKPK